LKPRGVAAPKMSPRVILTLATPYFPKGFLQNDWPHLLRSMAIFSVLPEILAALWRTVRFSQIQVSIHIRRHAELSHPVVGRGFNLLCWAPRRKRPRNAHLGFVFLWLLSHQCHCPSLHFLQCCHFRYLVDSSKH